MDSSVARTSALGVSWSGKGALVKSMIRGDRVEQGRAVERRSMLNFVRNRGDWAIERRKKSDVTKHQ